jgi:hypothetical protein
MTIIASAMLFTVSDGARAQLTITDISPDAPYKSANFGNATPSGRVPTLAIDRTNGDVFAASEWSGVWRSTNQGQSWSQVGKGLRSGASVQGGCCGPGFEGVPYSALAADYGRLLYAVQDWDGRVTPFAGGLWISLTFGSLWQQVKLPNCPYPSLTHVVFANGTPYVLGKTQGCRLWTADFPLSKWTALPDPPWPNGVSQILATAPYANEVYACANTAAGAFVYRNKNLAHSGAWDPPIPLAGGVGCVGLAGVPAAPTVGAIASSSQVLVMTDNGKVHDIVVVDFNNPNGAPTSLGFSAVSHDGCCGSTGVWVAPWNSNRTKYDVFAATALDFYYLSPQLGQAWTKLPNLHVDTWSVAVPAAYDPGAGNCRAFLANDGGVYADTGPSSCSQKGAADGWSLVSQGLHLSFVNGLTGVSNPIYTATLCPGAPHSYSACPSLYIGTTDDDAWESVGGGFPASFSWVNGGFGLGDAGIVFIDPIWPSVAMGTRNGNYVFYGATGSPPPDQAVTPDPPFQYIGNLIDSLSSWWGAGLQGIQQVMSAPSDLSLGPVWDYLTIASARIICPNNPFACGTTDRVSRMMSTGTPPAAPNWLLLDSPIFFGPGQIAAIAPTGGHQNLTVYVLTASDPPAGAYASWPSLGPGLIWRGDVDLNTGKILTWMPASGSGASALGQAFNLIANPYSTDEVYATVLKPTPSIKVTRNGGRTWSTDAGLTGIASHNGEFVIDCSWLPATHADKQVFGQECSLLGMSFDPYHPNIRLASLYPGGVALSRDFGLHWIPLDVTNVNANTAKGPIDLPGFVYYDPAPDWTLGFPSAYVGIEGHGVVRVDGLSPDLSVGQGICATCAGAALSPSKVQLVVPMLHASVPVQRDADGVWRGNVLFRGAGLESLHYQFVIDGTSTRTFVHPITPAERESGVMTLADH